MHHHRLRVWATAGTTLALCVAAVGATQASAGSSDPPSKLTVISTTLVQTGPAQGTSGDRYTFYDADSGGDQGNDYFTCAVTNPQGDGVCEGMFILSHGSISVVTEGNLNQPALQATGVITGGSGAYASARGRVVVSGTLAVTPFTFYFHKNQ